MSGVSDRLNNIKRSRVIVRVIDLFVYFLPDFLVRLFRHATCLFTDPSLLSGEARCRGSAKTRACNICRPPLSRPHYFSGIDVLHSTSFTDIRPPLAILYLISALRLLTPRIYQILPSHCPRQRAYFPNLLPPWILLELPPWTTARRRRPAMAMRPASGRRTAVSSRCSPPGARTCSPHMRKLCRERARKNNTNGWYGSMSMSLRRPTPARSSSMC